MVYWKGRKIHPKTGYYDLPWEKEAYKLQDKLALKVWKSGEIYVLDDRFVIKTWYYDL